MFHYFITFLVASFFFLFFFEERRVRELVVTYSSKELSLTKPREFIVTNSLYLRLEALFPCIASEAINHFLFICVCVCVGWERGVQYEKKKRDIHFFIYLLRQQLNIICLEKRHSTCKNSIWMNVKYIHTWQCPWQPKLHSWGQYACQCVVALPLLAFAFGLSRVSVQACKGQDYDMWNLSRELCCKQEMHLNREEKDKHQRAEKRSNA
jgi:hypothetical protein